MISNNPININDIVYNKYNMNLAINAINDNLHVALRLIPTNNEYDSTLDNNAISYLRGSTSELDDIEKACMNAILDAIQVLINTKGW